MKAMLERVLRETRNWFSAAFYTGAYRIEGGAIRTETGEAPALLDGQYFRILGSVLNDGVYQYPPDDLKDEAFTGEIWSLAIPKEFLELTADIEAWQEQHGAAAAGPYTSESFGGYTYSKAVDAVTGGAVTWEGAFRARLNAWRKL